MAFGDQAIGFFLQAENELSPELETAALDYERFVGRLEKWNKKAYKSASLGLGQLGNLVGAFASLPQQAAKGYEKALIAIGKKTKVISQPLDLVFTTKSEKALKRQFGEAIVQAMTGAKLRLGARVPAKRLGMFDTTASLRTLYKGLPQPPDMIGSMAPQKFAEGGVVDGPSNAVDSVRAMLTKGELVLPPDLSAALLAMAESQDKVAQLNDVVEAGLGSPADIKSLKKEIEGVQSALSTVLRESDALSFSQKQRLTPAIKDATSQLEGFKQEAEDTKGVMNNLLRNIMGPARFLAVSKAVETLTEGVSNLATSAQGAFGDLEEGKTESFITNMNQLNRVLQLSRTELRALKKQAAALALDEDLDLNAVSEALEGMALAGMRDTKAMLALAPAVSSMAGATNAAVDDLGKVAFRLGGDFKFTEDQIAGTFDNIRKFAAATASDTGQLVTDLSEQLERIGPTLEASTAAEGQAIVSNLARLGASLSDVWAGETNTITGMISNALGGDIDAIQSLGTVFSLNVGQMTEKLKSGDLEGLLDGLAGQINAMGDNTQGLEILRDTLGFEGTTAQFQNLGKSIDTINSNLVELGGAQHSLETMGEATTNLNVAAEAQLTFFGKLSKSVSQLSGKEIPGLGIQFGEIIDFTKEMNAGTLLSIVFLGKMGLQAAVAGAALVGKLGGPLGKIGGLLGGLGGKGKAAGGLSTVTSLGGKAAGAAGTGGMMAGIAGGLTTLAGGLTTFGTAMIGPGGIGLAALVLALIGIAAAARIAAPVFEIIGNVIMHMVDGFVEMFKAAVDADPRNLLLLGPAMLAGAVGVTAMGVAVGLYGAALLGASVGIAAFRIAAGLSGGLEGGVIVGTIEALIGELGPLQGQERKLASVNKVMGILVGFIGKFAAVAGALAVLGAGAVVGNAVTSMLGFFGVRSPMQQLAAGSGEMADTIVTMISNFDRLAQFGEGKMAGIAKIMSDMVGFMGDYARLSEQIEAMPGTSILEGIGDSITGFFGADSPAEKIAAQAGPIAASMHALLSRFQGVGNLRQSGPQSAISPDQIETIISATVNREADDRTHTDLQEQTSLLREMVSLLAKQIETGGQPAPSMRPMSGPRRGGNSTANGIAGFAV